jgi:hypothetical protein
LRNATRIARARAKSSLAIARDVRDYIDRVCSGQEVVGNPVLTWCAANAVVEMDASGNLKVSRRKSTEKIDGIVALAMAVGRWMAQPAESGFDFRIV